MADIVTVQTIADVAGVKHVAKMTNLSDGTGESLVTKIDASNTNAMTEDAKSTCKNIILLIHLIVSLVLSYYGRHN